MDNWIITDDGSECVVHAGILGMKWGRRRYQNKDGSLTPEGRLRYGSKSEDRDDKKDQKYDSRQLRRNLKTMSDKELQDVINRKEKEKRLRDMLDAEISPGKKKANEILSSIGSEVAKEVGKKATLAAMDMALKKLTSGNITASEFVRAMKITDFKSSVFDDDDSKPALTGKKKKNPDGDKQKQETKTDDQPKQDKKSSDQPKQDKKSDVDKAREEGEAAIIKARYERIKTAESELADLRKAEDAAYAALKSYKNEGSPDAAELSRLQKEYDNNVDAQDAVRQRLRELRDKK